MKKGRKLLFVHQNMPGQYRHLMFHYAAIEGNEVVGIGEKVNVKRNFGRVPERMKLLAYDAPKMPRLVGHPFLGSTEAFVFRGEVVGRILEDVKKKGFVPDVICAHPGWGEALYVKDVYPDVRLIDYCEFFYNTEGQDYGFDPEYPEAPYDNWGLRTRNAIQLLSLPSMDDGMTPTLWQKTRYPKEYQSKIKVAHEGVNTEVLKPDEEAKIFLQRAGIELRAGQKIITYVSRNLEPYRGFHIFMRTLPELLARHPDAHVVIVGGEEVSYGKQRPAGFYKESALREVGGKVDQNRVHFLGKIPYADYVRVLQISAVHVYLTYPFVLSWSLVEAMSVGCAIVASKTAPVEEVIEDGKEGVLVDFFDVSSIVKAVDKVLSDKKRMKAHREAARRKAVKLFDLHSVCLPRLCKFIESGN